MFKLFSVKVAWLYSSGRLQQIYQNMLIMFFLFTALVRSEASRCGICGEQGGSWTGFSLGSLLRSCLVSVVQWWNVPCSYSIRLVPTLHNPRDWQRRKQTTCLLVFAASGFGSKCTSKRFSECRFQFSDMWCCVVGPYSRRSESLATVLWHS